MRLYFIWLYFAVLETIGEVSPCSSSADYQNEIS